MSDGIYTKDVTDILDLFYENDGQEPDWAAIKTRLFLMEESYFKVILNLLRAFFAIYEDRAAYETLRYRLEMDLPE